jgi:arginyl-tRNA synthetase
LHFSTGLLAVGYEQFGSEEEFQKRPIRHLFDIYVKANQAKKDDASWDDKARQYFKRMEEGTAI